MCTVTIRRDAHGVLVTMNRDEKRARAPEMPPAPGETRGTRWLGPRDGTAGGTWCAVNEYGIVSCLLNAYQPGDLAATAREGAPSRGEIIPGLLGRGNYAATIDYLGHRFRPEPYASFDLIVTGRDFGLRRRWLGHDDATWHSLHEPWAMFTSSSWRTGEVLAWRGEVFDDWVRDGAPFVGLLPEFHVHQPLARAEWAPLMNRPHAHTRSITQVWIPEGERYAEMRYWPEPTVEPGPPARVDQLLLKS